MNDADRGGDHPPARPWDDLLTDHDRQVVARGGFGQRGGLGNRPAILVIDAQNYMVGPPPASSHDYPSACGPAAIAALDHLAALLAVAREESVPIIYTRFELRRDGGDIGAYGNKRVLLSTEGWCLEGSEGARIADQVAPEESDLVLVKKKPSAFFGTPVAGLLVDRGVDTVIVTGGSTSNCVRATAVDAVSFNFRVIIPEDCVFDRIEISHRVSLFDLDRQYADVVSSRALIDHLRSREDT
jgi:nicotinamidase-related amidase